MCNPAASVVLFSPGRCHLQLRRRPVLLRPVLRTVPRVRSSYFRHSRQSRRHGVRPVFQRAAGSDAGGVLDARWTRWQERSQPVAASQGLVPSRNRQKLGRSRSRQRKSAESEGGVQRLPGTAIRSANATIRAANKSYGFTMTLPNIWLFSRYSCAARISLSGKTRSTTGLSRPANT